MKLICDILAKCRRGEKIAGISQRTTGLSLNIFCGPNTQVKNHFVKDGAICASARGNMHIYLQNIKLIDP